LLSRIALQLARGVPQAAIVGGKRRGQDAAGAPITLKIFWYFSKSLRMRVANSCGDEGHVSSPCSSICFVTSGRFTDS
jgi:hypothetical protein